MSKQADPLFELQQWYEAQCDGDWEHDFGVTVNTLDNPGWALIVDLTDTLLEHRPFQPLKTEDLSSWMDCSVSEGRFRGFCGPRDLESVINVFLDWAKTVPDWLGARPELPSSLEQELSAQSRWEMLSQEAQPEKCQKEGCHRRRIQYAIFCRSHHYEQLAGSKPPEAKREIWLYGNAEMVQHAKERILDVVRETYGSDSILSANDSANTLLLQWMKKPVELMLDHDSVRGIVRIYPGKRTAVTRDNSELLLRLVFNDIVEPVCDTTGGVVASLNVWEPEP